MKLSTAAGNIGNNPVLLETGTTEPGARYNICKARCQKPKLGSCTLLQKEDFLLYLGCAGEQALAPLLIGQILESSVRLAFLGPLVANTGRA